jgi:glutamate-1-semialdehyde 2,1-aminomutase
VYYEPEDPESLEAALRANAGDVAAVFVTPFIHEVFRDGTVPSREFAARARQLCDQHGSLLIVDDVRAGFRLARDCSWSIVDVQPDLSTWGKCFANGYPISALLGSESARKGAEQMFVTGSFWFGATAMAAAIETLRQIRETHYLESIINAGERLRRGLDQQAASHGFKLRQSGPVQMPQILFEDDPDFRVGYSWATEALKRGAYIHPYHNNFLSAAHYAADIDIVLCATDEAFAVTKKNRDKLSPHPFLTQILAEH